MKQNKKKAFTLAELLVVVIVLGVLVAVAVPKFRRTLETRRTTEAENMLSAIRTEQEKRCIMGYDYQTDATKLGALAKAGSSKHYDYSLQSTGATATTEGYNLQIPSYKDGRICCSGEGCEALNKNYPSCESLTLPADECAAAVSTPTEPEPEPEPEPEETCTNGDRDSILGEVINGMCHDTVQYFRTCEDDHWQISSSITKAFDQDCCRPGQKRRSLPETRFYLGSNYYNWDSNYCREEIGCTESGEKIQIAPEECFCAGDFIYNSATDACEAPTSGTSCAEDSRPVHDVVTERTLECTIRKLKTLTCVDGVWQEKITEDRDEYYHCNCFGGHSSNWHTLYDSTNDETGYCEVDTFRPCDSRDDPSTWISTAPKCNCLRDGIYEEATGRCLPSEQTTCQPETVKERRNLSGYKQGIPYTDDSEGAGYVAGYCLRNKYIVCDSSGNAVVDHTDEWECTCDKGYTYINDGCVKQ